MPTPSRTSTAQIVAAGRVILEAEGFEGLTMQRVAAAVGVRAPSLYKRVDGRGELVRLITADAAADLSRALEAAATDRRSGTGPGRIATAFRAFAHAHPEAYALLFRRLPEGWNPDVDLGSPGFAALFGTVEAISGPDDGWRPPARSSPGPTGSSGWSWRARSTSAGTSTAPSPTAPSGSRRRSASGRAPRDDERDADHGPHRRR